MHFTPFALAALASLEGVLAHSGHEPVPQPLVPEYREPMRAQPLLPALDDSLSLGLAARGLLNASVDGSCGVSSTCEGSSFGTCCSRDGWCGSSDAFCGAGCREGYGKCDTFEELKARQAGTDSACDAPTATSTSTTASSTASSTSTTSVAAQATTTSSSTTVQAATTTTSSTAAATTIPASKNGKCGASVNAACRSLLAPCCSKSGTCGLSCLKLLGCQAKYGWCM